jgi:hypothetical protein
MAGASIMTNSTAWALAIRRLAPLVLVATGAAVALASDLGIGPGPVLLRLKPHGSPLVYSSHETTIQVELRRKGEPVVHRYEFDKTLRRTTRGDPAGPLAMKIEVLALKALMDGRPLDVPAAPPMQQLVTVRGPLVGEGHPVGPPMGLALPESPLPPPMILLGAKSLEGTEWTWTSEPTQSLPLEVETRYRVAGIARVGGHECVLIKTSATALGPALGGRISLEVWGRGQIAFDPGLGIPVETTCELRVGQAFRKPTAQDPLRIDTETRSSVRLKP